MGGRRVRRRLRSVGGLACWGRNTYGECTPPGGIDKALLEAMAAGCIVLTSNYVMARYMQPYFQKLMFRVGQSEELAERISSLGEYDDISRALATNVKTDHDLSMLASRLAQLL